MKVTAVSMGVMNCSDPAVLRRAYDLGINFYDTAPSYMRGINEEMVGEVFEMAALLKETAKSSFHDVALVSYNFTHSKNLRDAVAMAVQSGIVAMKTQAGGYKKEKMKGLTPHQAALKYVLMDQNVSAAVPGVTSIEQIEECMAFMGTSFTKEDLNLLREYQSFLNGRICTMCGGCIGECPSGVSHHDLLRLAMYHDGYENDSLIRESLEIMVKDIQHCSECPSCSVICRRGLDIRAQVQLAKQIFFMKISILASPWKQLKKGKIN